MDTPPALAASLSRNICSLRTKTSDLRGSAGGSVVDSGGLSSDVVVPVVVGLLVASAAPDLVSSTSPSSTSVADTRFGVEAPVALSQSVQIRGETYRYGSPAPRLRLEFWSCRLQSRRFCWRTRLCTPISLSGLYYVSIPNFDKCRITYHIRAEGLHHYP